MVACYFFSNLYPEKIYWIRTVPAIFVSASPCRSVTLEADASWILIFWR